ncbi:MAG: CCA tRNA nucleotidyltransferase [Alphaproteobacteria bacterium]|nr:CCA tRNA nucleotidyltransferase [Alphaproteobacteria bacterium]
MRVSPSNWPHFSACEKLFALLSQEGGEARFIGGCVRDAVLNRPIGDLDIACSHRPEKTMSLLLGAGLRVIPTGLQHGTVTAIVDGIPFEITTLREDMETDGRHAVVRFTHDWKADAARRDFTMNALSCGLDGEVQDYWNGLEDAKSGIVRFIGDPRKRIEEDALRILRFFRFSAHYGQPPFEYRSLTACAEKAKLVESLSGERIQSEMLRLLEAKTASYALGIMQKEGVLVHIGLSTTEASLAAVKRLQDPILRLSALLRAMPDSPKATDALVQRWKLSNALRDTLMLLIAAKLDDIGAWDEKLLKRLLRSLGKERYMQLVTLAAAEQGKTFSTQLKLAETWEIPTFPITGAMLKSKGFSEGKALGDALKKLETLWEEADYQLSAEDLMKNAPRAIG